MIINNSYCNQNHHSSGDAIGDIKNTIRNDLDDSWLLCDGSYFDAEIYPELGELVPKDFSGTWDYKGDDGCPITGPLYKKNGYYIRYNSSAIYYSTKWPCGASDWQAVLSDDKFSGWSITGFYYAAGKWIVPLYYSYSNPAAYAISNTNAIDGAYTMTRLNKDYSESINSVYEYGGKAWCIGYRNSSWNRWYVSGTTLIDSGSCTGLQTPSSTNQTRYWSNFQMANGILYASHYNKASNDSNHYIRAQISLDGGANWTSLQVLNGGSSSWCRSFVLGNTCYAYLSTGKIFKIDSSTGLPVQVTATGTMMEDCNVVEKDGIVFFADSKLCLTNSSFSSETSTLTNADNVFIDNNEEIYALNGTKYYKSSGTKVPTISADNSLVYIKAK